MAKYEMTLTLNVLNHLGLNLYSNTPAVLSEVIANSHDADATKVEINVSQDETTITIQDNGNGMSLQEINDKFLTVGYEKRENGEGLSKKYSRPVMGRKGIGKLSLLSIANEIEIHSLPENGVGNALKLERSQLEHQIKTNNGKYHPQEVDFKDFGQKHGTKIIIKDFARDIARTESYLRPRLAKRFILKDTKPEFKILINGKPLTIDDRNYFKKLEFLWPVGDYDTTSLTKFSNIKILPKLNGKIDEKLVISGWIGTVDKPSDLKEGADNNNKISVFTRGKLAQEDILAFYNEGGMYSSYIIGEIHADFLDTDKEKDIATSNRQQFNENDLRFVKLQGHIHSLLKVIQSKWTDLRNEVSMEKATIAIPELKTWYESHGSDDKKSAKKIFSVIENLHFDKEIHKKKEIYKFAILAFERLKVSNKLSEIDQMKDDSLSIFGKIFSEMQDIEATLYYDIASQRVKVIDQLIRTVKDNEKEKILQEHLFDNLWLLDASWDRATAGTQFLETTVQTQFGKVSAKLTPEEQKGRIDIKYRNAANKHLIIELKRYVAGYRITPGTLMDQTGKYMDALRKILISQGDINPTIESICVVGKDAIDDLNAANAKLISSNVRIITYDMLIAHAQSSYQDYLDQNVKVGKIRALIEKL